MGFEVPEAHSRPNLFLPPTGVKCFLLEVVLALVSLDTPLCSSDYGDKEHVTLRILIDLVQLSLTRMVLIPAARVLIN